MEYILDFLKDALIASAVTIVGWLIKKVWNYLTSDNTPINPEVVDMKRSKRQFFGYLIALIFFLIIAGSFNSTAIKICSYIFSAICFIAVWGAFDQIYNLLDHYDKKHRE